jgi:arsenical pump membrane protein
VSDLALWHAGAIWAIALVSIALILIHPKDLPEAVWAVLGAGLLIVCRLVTVHDAVLAVNKGLDVYLFLAGMMIMSELARREGVFDWLATHAVKAARGSRRRLFLLVYGVGTVVTVFLSNDATAVVLTPAVQAAVKAASVEPLPFLLICAFVANAASFVLPISNPANLVVYGKTLPRLGNWLATFALASVASIALTCLTLRWLSRKLLAGEMTNRLPQRPLTPSGLVTFGGIGFLAVVLLTASAVGKDLGAPTCLAGLLVAAAVTFRDSGVPRDIIKEVPWSVIPLVAALFVIVAGINRAGALPAAVSALQTMKSWPAVRAALCAAFSVAALSNVLNNLPSGLIAGSAIATAGITGKLRDAVLVGVDLGPNLSVSGSLATILWLLAVRREGQRVSFWQFLKWGAMVMPPALLAAVLALMVH